MRFMAVSVGEENYFVGKTNFMWQPLNVSYKKGVCHNKCYAHFPRTFC